MRKRREWETSQVQKDKEPITEVPITEDVEEDSEPLIVRRRKEKAIILDSESTETVEVHKDKPESIPILSMLEKNVVADQHAWDETFRNTDVDTNLVWGVDEEEEEDRDEGDNQSKTPRATHISGGSVL